MDEQSFDHFFLIEFENSKSKVLSDNIVEIFYDGKAHLSNQNQNQYSAGKKKLAGYLLNRTKVRNIFISIPLVEKILSNEELRKILSNFYYSYS